MLDIDVDDEGERVDVADGDCAGEREDDGDRLMDGVSIGVTDGVAVVVPVFVDDDGDAAVNPVAVAVGVDMDTRGEIWGGGGGGCGGCGGGGGLCGGTGSTGG